MLQSSLVKRRKREREREGWREGQKCEGIKKVMIGGESTSLSLYQPVMVQCICHPGLSISQ